MKAQRPVGSDDEHRVIPFRPRQTQNCAAPATQLDAAARQEAARQHDQNEFRHRMLANLAAFIFTAVLTGIGIWLATTMTDLRKEQDCRLLGRHDCVRPSANSG